MQAPTAYTYTDSRPLPGTAYYRLRQVDTDGRATYSPVITVSCKPMLGGVYPNPMAGTVHLPFANPPLTYQVFDMMGRRVLVGEASGQLDLEALPAGSYLLKLHTGAGSTLQRVQRL